MSGITGFVKLVRPINCVMMSFAVLVGAVLANSSFSSFSLLNILFGALTGFTLTAASMAVNDYYDRKIDAINEPSRPIPSGTVTARNALVLTGVLSVIGFIFAYLTSIICLVAAVIAWAAMLTYTTVGKRSGLPGNFLVSACVATPFLYGSLTVVGAVQLNVLLFASMAFFSNAGREITKGIVDVKGDNAENVKTLAVRFGEKKAAVVAAVFYVFAVCLSPVPLVLGLVSFWFVPFVLITDFGLLGCSVLLVKNPSRENARHTKKLVLILFILGLFAFLFGMVGEPFV
jgi:geranylgeranylglycerol-phosphate geranylgeranyltransferase